MTLLFGRGNDCQERFGESQGILKGYLRGNYVKSQTDLQFPLRIY